ncbi:hypothetical protein [Deinococcus enclensis]|uniref:Uncharacterized protein n=1 Tax=Deinococcus enclensis TaxID=1049582 RepID=A0ABT9MB96_9DEIO|nr:hypothetical protein [Deinococcus enclensis]MDP9763846.1 hypothetical protein [Deinococcus enclensis]
MAKPDTVKLIKETNGAELDADNYTQTQLNALLGLAKGGDRGAFDAKLAEFDAAREDDSEEGSTPTLKVKVNPDKGSGSYLHPEGKQAIVRDGAAVSVPDDAWTQDMVAKRFLIEVRK